MSPCSPEIVARLTSLDGESDSIINLTSASTQWTIGKDKSCSVRLSGVKNVANFHVGISRSQDEVTGHWRFSIQSMSARGIFLGSSVKHMSMIRRGNTIPIISGMVISFTSPVAYAGVSNSYNSIVYRFDQVFTSAPPTDDEKELQCPICQEMFHRPVITVPCAHTLCSSCLSQWVMAKRKGECPVCRQSVVTVVKALVVDRLVTSRPQVRATNDLDAKDELFNNGYSELF